MNSRTFLSTAACALALSFCVTTTAQATTINVTYDYTLTGSSGSPYNLPIIGLGTGSVNPLGSMTWIDVLTSANPATGQAGGTFTMTFGNGDTLFGSLQEQLDLSSPPIVPFTQILDVTGGSGGLLLYRGILTGSGTVNLALGTALASGAGTLATIPEPGSVVLLGTGLACLLLYRKRRLLFRKRPVKTA